MKTPDEIKRGLDAIAETDSDRRYVKVAAISASYRYFEDVAADALAYIKRLEAERDALKDCIERCGELCGMCKKAADCDAADGDCLTCKSDCPCRDCVKSGGAEGYEWDGGKDTNVPTSGGEDNF